MRKSILFCLAAFSLLCVMEPANSYGIKLEGSQIGDGIVTVKFKDVVNDLKIEVIWKPDRLINGYVIGPAIIELANVKQGGSSTVVNNHFGIQEYRLSEFISWRSEEGGNKIENISGKVIHLEYKRPVIAEEDYSFGTTEEPFFFYDINFDGREELLLCEMFTGQRFVSIFRPYKMEETQDWDVLESDFTQITYQEPYLSLDEMTTVDKENKTITINLSGGASFSKSKVYKLQYDAICGFDKYMLVKE